MVVPAATGRLFGDAAALTGGSDRLDVSELADGTLRADVDGSDVGFHTV
ncbi:hypothetical protein [Halosolutus halophilus]|nr:hypothetical protein [Halosolutus halophilus]